MSKEVIFQLIFTWNILKGTVHGLRSNKSETAIVRSSKAIGVIKGEVDKFDQQNKVPSSNKSHHISAIKIKLEIIVKELNHYQVFDTFSGRKYQSFVKPVDVVHIKPTKDIFD